MGSVGGCRVGYGNERQLTEAVINHLWPRDYEQKLINEYNAATMGIYGANRVPMPSRKSRIQSLFIRAGSYQTSNRRRLCNPKYPVIWQKRFSELGIKQRGRPQDFQLPTGVYHGRSEQRNRSYRLYPRNEKHNTGKVGISLSSRRTVRRVSFHKPHPPLKVFSIKFPKRNLPFIITIRRTKCGNGKIYHFT